jgi:hypothetical protein
MYTNIFLLAALLAARGAAKNAVNKAGCPFVPTPARVPRNATRLLFVGAHHTGTNSYIEMLKHHGVPKELRAGIAYPGHNQGWFSDPRQVLMEEIFLSFKYISPLSVHYSKPQLFSLSFWDYFRTLNKDQP